MYIIAIVLLTLILSWGVSELGKAQGEVLIILNINIPQKRKNLTPSANYVRFKLASCKLHKKAYKLS